LINEAIKKGKSAKDIEIAKWQIYNSLREGRCFIANDYVAESKGFRFYAESDGHKYQMGDIVSDHKNLKLKVFLPGISAEIRLLRNGHVLETNNGIDAEFVVNKKGAYRIEVYNEQRAWIYSNHIRVNI
jgi:hypothetical protein